MRRWLTWAVLAAGFLALAPVPGLTSSAGGPTGWVAGQVVDYASGAPLAGALVERVAGPERARAAADGSFLLALPAGRHRLRASAPGYLAEEETQVLAPASGGTVYTFALLPLHTDPATAAAVAERWQRGERPAGAQVPADDRFALQQAVPRARPHRALLPHVQRGCEGAGALAATGAAGTTIRVLLPNDCVVTMDLEEYLKGVVPAEMPPSWPAEALKAQAIAARTYALGRAPTLPGGAHVDATTLTQAYTTRRYASTDAAVEATRGQVLTYQGRLAEVFYFADSGGATEASEHVWGGRPQPYLRGVDDSALTPTICARATTLCWSVTVSEPQLRAQLALTTTIASVAISATYPSGRLKTLTVATVDQQTVTTTRLTEHWRRILETKSALITSLSRRPDGAFALVGRGWGHGLGLPQWGAWARAQQGQTHAAILQHYFPGTTLGIPPPRGQP